MRRLFSLALVGLLTGLGSIAFAETDEEIWAKTAQNGEVAREAFLKSWRFVQGWLQCVDPASGLFPRNLKDSPYWNARDNAADNYPFMVLTTFLTDRPLFEGRMKEILATEQRLCNRVDRLPDDFLFETQAFRTPEPNLKDIIFGASEYCKDGLLPLTEFLGPSPWSDRMLMLVDDVWKNAKVETEVGILPANDHEVAGDLLQVLSRMYWMTGNDTYRAQAFLLGDFFLLHNPPARAEQLKLDDHGCEVVNGLSEVYLIAAKTDPERHERWKTPMHELLDRIVASRDENGLLYNVINPVTAEKKSNELTDNWGYNYNAFLVVAELDNEPKYREAVEFVLTHLLNAKDYKWENGIADGYADSLEGGINLMNRIPTPEAAEWADYVARLLLDKPRDTGIIEGWHGDGNFARTALMYAFWKTQGAWLEPWRADLRIGATVTEEGYTAFEVRGDWAWEGRLRFDKPRHRENMKMPWDYPRLNQFPEWFTVPEFAWCYDKAGGGQVEGKVLREGLPVTIEPQKPFRIILKPQPPTPDHFRMPINSRSPEEFGKWQKNVRAELAQIVEGIRPRKDTPLDATLGFEAEVPVLNSLRQEVTFKGNDGEQIQAWLTVPKSPGPHPAVICLHGHGGDRDKVYDPESVYTGFAAEFARRGFITLAPSLGHHKYAAEELWNLIRLVDLLEADSRVEKSRIGCAGLSMGGEWAMWLAACDLRIKAAVISGWMCTTEGALRIPNCPCWRPDGLLTLCDIAEVNALIAPRPVLFESAESDQCFPVDATVSGFAKIRRAYELLETPDLAVHHTFPGDHRWNGGKAYAFMETHNNRLQ